MSDSPSLVRTFEVSSFGRKPAAAKADAPEQVADHRCFGYLPGVQDQAFNLEFRRGLEADSFALPYSWLGPHYYHPSFGIVLVFGGPPYYVVRIRGCHLNTETNGVSLYERGILRHRVPYVCEAGRVVSDVVWGEGDCKVERIEAVLARDEMELLAVTGLPFSVPRPAASVAAVK